ncbi:universal stress protein [Streptomyces palmae]|uniref:Universal stress protein n=1 Tax=Streptomyces palmae TaxID=1701085 RepID=A0A4Z0FQ42_9ACTN|nr:universal stress protein [Streptomyces palmae]TGA83432.1 universal stress protein [Streptomyces palmae]
MPGTITVGLDGTEHSLAAADWAADEASVRGATLRLVYAWQPPSPLDLPVAVDPVAVEAQAHEVLHQAEARVRARRPEPAVTGELLPTEPVPALLAESEGADMLVLGSRGHGPLVGFLLGSVSLQVVRQANGPVVVVRDTAAPEAQGAEERASEVVVGVQDAGEDAAPVLEFAFAAAAARGAPLRAVRAWSLPTPLDLVPSALRPMDEAGGPEAFNRSLLEDALRTWRERYPEVPVATHVEIGGASEVLLSQSGRAALVVVGRRTQWPAALRGIGSVTHAALHHARCPVAVVPHR